MAEAEAIPAAQPARPDQLTLLAFAGVVVFGAINAIAVKVTVGELDPFWSAGLRFVVAGLLLVLIVAATGRTMPRGKSFAGALLYGAVALSGSFGFIYPALREVPAVTAVIFLALVPLLTFGLTILQGQERFHIRGLLGALIALAGVAVVVADQLTADVPLVPLAMIFVGVLFVAEGAGI